VEGKKPPERLLAAIAYKNGVDQAEPAERYDVQRRTMYNWLKRLDTDESLEHAVVNAHHSRKRQKLSELHQQEFEETVHDPPEEIGTDAPASTPAIVQQFLDDTYDVEYSIPSCRQLLKEAGLSYQKSRRKAAEADEDDQEVFHDEFKKAAGDGRHNSLYRPNQEIRASRAACRVVSARHAAVHRALWPAGLDVFARRDHRGR